MKRLAIVITSHKGHTTKIAERLAERFSLNEVQADVFNLLDLDDTSTLDLKLYDGVLVGGPIYYGEFSEQLIDFVSKNMELLSAKSVSFFSVGLSSSCRENVRRFLSVTGLKPRQVALFEGAVSFTKSGWIGRLALSYFSKSNAIKFDRRQDHVMTDWGLVDQLADDFLSNRMEMDRGSEMESIPWTAFEVLNSAR